jgi:membrane protein DedA with SNARE-associated domain
MTAARLAELLESWGYAAYLFLLGITGAGSPIPEDLILATGGYMISAGIFSWAGAIVAGVAGVVGSDALLYYWGTRLRVGAQGGWTSRFFTPRHVRKVEKLLVRFGDKTVFIARLLPGTRAVTFVGAGVRHMAFGRFLLLDTAGALLWVPAVLLLGARIGEEIGGLDRVVASAGRSAFWVGVTVLVLVLAWSLWRAEQSKL